MKKSILIASLTVLLGVTPAICRADGENEFVDTPTEETISADGISPPLDPRLPPVLPGEQVDRNGQKINVWSTSGGVPTSQPPQQQWNNNGQIPPGLGGIIVDTTQNGQQPPPIRPHPYLRNR